MSGSRFDYIKYDEKSQAIQEDAKKICQLLEALIVSITVDNPKAVGRSADFALLHLEEAYMWIGKAIRDNQLDRSPGSVLQEERKNG